MKFKPGQFYCFFDEDSFGKEGMIFEFVTQGKYKGETFLGFSDNERDSMLFVLMPFSEKKINKGLKEKKLVIIPLES